MTTPTPPQPHAPFACPYCQQNYQQAQALAYQLAKAKDEISALTDQVQRLTADLAIFMTADQTINWANEYYLVAQNPADLADLQIITNHQLVQNYSAYRKLNMFGLFATRQNAEAFLSDMIRQAVGTITYHPAPKD